MPSVRDIFIRLGIKSDPRKLERFNQGLNAMHASAIGLGRVFATGALAVGFKRMVDTASDIEETANKFGAVFGDVGADVQTQLDDIRKRTGATNMELQEMSSNIGALIKPALGTAEAAGEMAANVSELVLDISSFNNKTSKEALVAFRSGLIGSAEPMQGFGVDLRVAAIELEAMRQGIGKSIKEMTEGERIQLRYAAAVRQLSAQGAVGDATRTAKGFANASRNLGAAIKETAGIIGTFFLGSVGGMVNKTRELVDRFQSWITTNRELLQQGLDRFLDRTSRVISAVVTTIKAVVSAVDDWLDSLGPLGDQLRSIIKTVAILATILLLPGGSMLLLIGLIALLIEDFQTWRKGGESVLGDIAGGFKTLAGVIDGFRQGAVDALVAFNDWLDENAVTIRVVTSLVLGLATAIGVSLVMANKAAIASFIAFKAFALQYYAVMAAQAVRTAAIAAVAGLKVAAAWLVAIAPIALTIALLGALAAAIVFVIRDLEAMGEGGESFFGTMITGINELIDKWDGLGGAIMEMLRTAWDFWSETFGTIGDVIGRFFGEEGAAGPTATATRTAAAAGANLSNNQQTTINLDVQAGPNVNAEQLAEVLPPLLAREQARQNRAAARNFAQGVP
jgi:hypothetical protein